MKIVPNTLCLGEDENICIWHELNPDEQTPQTDDTHYTTASWKEEFVA